MPVTFVFTKTPPLKQSVNIGTFIPVVTKSHVNPVPSPPPALVEEKDFTVVNDRNIEELLRGESRSSFRLHLSRLLLVHGEREEEAQRRVKASRCRVYEHVQPLNLFDTLVPREDVQKKIEKFHNIGCNVYLITGCCTLTDAKMGEMEKTGSEVGGGVTVPVAEVVAGVPDPAGLGDVSADVARKDKESREGVRTLEGDRVFAVKVAKVRTKFFSGEEYIKVDNKWMPFTRQMGAAKENRGHFETSLVVEDGIIEQFKPENERGKFLEIASLDSAGLGADGETKKLGLEIHCARRSAYLTKVQVPYM